MRPTNQQSPSLQSIKLLSLTHTLTSSQAQFVGEFVRMHSETLATLPHTLTSSRARALRRRGL